MPEEIIKIVREYINTPLENARGDGGYVTPSSDALRRSSCVYVEEFWHNSRCECHRLLQHISGWLPSARTNKNLKARFEALYRTLEKRPDARAHYIINCEDDVRDLLKNNRLCVICGNRGIGKTAALNYWLSLYGETKLSKEGSVAWFKIDASRIYEIWNEQNNESKHFCEYVQLYLASDLLFHSRSIDGFERYKSDLFCELRREIRKEDSHQKSIDAAVSIVNQMHLEGRDQDPDSGVVVHFEDINNIHTITLHALLHNKELKKSSRGHTQGTNYCDK